MPRSGRSCPDREYRPDPARGGQAAVEIVALVRAEGLRPVDPPARVARIGEGDVGVVCWMEIRSAGD